MQDVDKSTKSYLAELDADINTDRIAHGKKKLFKAHLPEVKETKISNVVTESGYMVRNGKPVVHPDPSSPTEGQGLAKRGVG